MFEDLPGDDDVGAAVGERDGRGVAPDGGDAVRGRGAQRRRREVDPDVAVALARHVRREEPRSAPEVHQHRAVALGRGHERAPGRRQPVQHRERTSRFPPAFREVVVLAGVVAGTCASNRGHAPRLTDSAPWGRSERGWALWCGPATPSRPPR